MSEATNEAMTETLAETGANGLEPGDVAPPLLRPEEEDNVLVLFRRLRGPIEGVRNRDRDSLRDHLVLRHTALVEHCARGFAGSGEPIEDLVQEGYVGLIKAIDRFDPDKGVRFSTYACHLISGEMRHYLRDLGKLIHEPGWHSELRQRVTRAGEQLAQRLNRPAQPEEIAETLSIGVDQVRGVLQKQHLLTVESLDRDSGNESDEGSGRGADWQPEMAAADTGATAETRIDDQMLLSAALPQLRDLEKQALTMFFFEELSKTEIARRLDISINYAAYLVKRGVEHLRQIIEESEVVRPWPQLEARATQLLAVLPAQMRAESIGAGTGAVPATTWNGAERRAPVALAGAPLAAPVPVVRSGVASFTQFVMWLDEETERAQRYDHEYGLVWLRVSNWREVVEALDDFAIEAAMQAVQNLTRRCCRGVDKVAMLPTGRRTGLQFVVLMPHTGVASERVGKRWLKAWNPAAIHPTEPGALAAPRLSYVFALFPRDGKTGEALFEFLAAQPPVNAK